MYAWCGECHECQLVNPPLCPLPLIEVSFEIIGMDCVGPLEWCTWGYHFVLVLVDYAMWYPETVPLHNISASNVADSSMLSPRSGLTRDLHITDTMQALWIIRDSIDSHQCLPSANRSVERFNQLLKNVIRTFVHVCVKWLKPLLFEVREALQASTGFPQLNYCTAAGLMES